MDAIDIRLLDLVQHDATATVKELAAKVGLSVNACWRRIQTFEREGYICSRVALLNPAKLGVPVVVFVSVRAPEHTIEWINQFSDVARSMPEVVEFYRLTGDFDYLIKMRVANINHYDMVYKAIISQIKITHISSFFVVEEIKNSTHIPMPVVPGDDGNPYAVRMQNLENQSLSFPDQNNEFD